MDEREHNYPPHHEKYAQYSLSTWKTELGSAMRRRAVPICETVTDFRMRDGDDGWRYHWHHGMVGALQYWACGNRANIVKMLVEMADEFGVKAEVANQLQQNECADFEAQLAVARNVKGAIQGLKPRLGSCCEKQRAQYHVVLAAAFGPPAAEGDRKGSARKIGAYLHVPVGARYYKSASGERVCRPYASRKAQDARAVFDSEVERQTAEFLRTPQVGDVVLSHGEQAELLAKHDDGCTLRVWDGEKGCTIEKHFTSMYGSNDGSASISMPPELKVGDSVIAHGDEAELVKLLPNGGCVIAVCAGGHMQEHTYEWRFGKKVGSARLHRPPALLLSTVRATRSDAVSAGTRILIREHAKEVCPLSPCKRDSMSRLVGPRVWEKRQALILMFPLHTLCALFMAAHPGLLQESQYRVVIRDEVWELKHAYRETCLCRCCFNMRCYREALKVVVAILTLLLQRAESAGAPDESHLDGGSDERTELNGVQHTRLDAHGERLKRLIDFCNGVEAPRKERLTLFICADTTGNACRTARCVRGECSNCGFKLVWSKSLKNDIVDVHGELKAGASKAWVQEIEWSRIKTGGDGSSSEDDLRQQRSGSIIQFLDEFEPVQLHNVRHSFHIDQSKEAEMDFYQNCIPGVISCKSDWSENGSLEKRRQMQSEYWVIVHYSLLISIASFLVSSVWVDRSSILPIGAEVTVEPSDYIPCEGSVENVEGSFWARVECRTMSDDDTAVAYTDAEDVLYSVRSKDGQLHMVARSRLRHRKWHRIAFVQVTNDKKHDLYSTSAFATRRQEYFQKWHDCGHGAAMEWARDDTAERERVRVETARTTAAAAGTETDTICRDASTAAHDVAADVAAAHDAAADVAAAAGADVDDDPVVKAAKEAVDAARRLIPMACLPRPRVPLKQALSDAEFNRWLQKLEREKFWGWVEDTDNATHFKSKEMLHYWSQRLEETVFMRIAWVEFGCPGHGKEPWDGLGAMVKTKVSRDLTNEQCLTPTHDIDSALEVAQHTRATFSTKVHSMSAELQQPCFEPMSVSPLLKSAVCATC